MEPGRRLGRCRVVAAVPSGMRRVLERPATEGD